VANKSKAMDIPDFTRGAWKTNKPVDILLEKGANTKVLARIEDLKKKVPLS